MESIIITKARRPSRSRVNPSFSGSLPGYPETEENWEEDEIDSLPLPDHFPDPYEDPEREKVSRSSVTLETGATLVFRPPQPKVTATQPVVTSPKPAVTSPKPAVTSPKPAVASPKPAVACPKLAVTPPKSAVKGIQSVVNSSVQQTTTHCTEPRMTAPEPVTTLCIKPVAVSSMSEIEDDVERRQVKEGIRKITHKYATPADLPMIVSVSSSDPQSPPLSSKETLPSSPVPSITLTPSPPLSSSPTAPLPVSTMQTKDPVSVSSVQSRISTASDKASSIQTDRNVPGLSATTPTSDSGRSLSTSVSAFSNVSSNMSDFPVSPFSRNSVFTSSFTGENGLLGTSRYQSVSGIPLTASLGDGVTEQDVQQVEMFYRSHKSDVTVCRCLANLYLGSASSKASCQSMPSLSAFSDLWQFVTTGIPLVVEDSGEHHRCRQVSLVLAEKGTGFVLWKDAITSLSHYSCPQSNFHTLTLSSDASKLVGLSLDDSKAAAEFGAYITQLTSEFDDDSGSFKKTGKRKKKKESKKMKYKSPKKTDISRPCYFQHITKLERPQVTGVMPLPPNSFPSAYASGLSDILRDRLSVSSRTHSYGSDLSESCTLASDQ